MAFVGCCLVGRQGLHPSEAEEVFGLHFQELLIHQDRLVASIDAAGAFIAGPGDDGCRVYGPGSRGLVGIGQLLEEFVVARESRVLRGVHVAQVRFPAIGAAPVAQVRGQQPLLAGLPLAALLRSKNQDLVRDPMRGGELVLSITVLLWIQ